MNTVHDVGGVDGFTLKDRDQGFPLNEKWERDIWGMALALWASESWPSRADIERLPPHLYLKMPYYAKWLQSQEEALIRRGWISRDELTNPEGPINIPTNPKTILKSSHSTEFIIGGTRELEDSGLIK